ncbi:MAG: hypothetical protein C0483_01190 [Pirellula sp.]|nr:hypothetical protein [Pirellula sp.]
MIRNSAPTARQDVRIAASQVLFDLDGTLVDSHPGIAWSASVALSEVLPEVIVSVSPHLLGPPIREIFQRLLEAESRECTPELLDELEQAFRRSYDTEGWRRSRTYPEVGETLRQLHWSGFELFVVTNKPRAATRRILGRLELLPLFVEVVSPDSRTPRYENKAAMIHELVVRHDLDRESTCYVGDTRDDQIAAAAANVAFIPIGYGYGTPDSASGISPLSRLSSLGNVLRLSPSASPSL